MNFYHNLIKPTDHKLHVRTHKLSNETRHRMRELCKTIGVTITSGIGPYQNFYTYVPNELNRIETQIKMNKLFKDNDLPVL